MGKTLLLGSLFGIRVTVHWTFSILVAWVLFTSLLSGDSLGGAISSVVFVLLIFGCVVLHELGHALAARSFGIGTRDITLLPIGGIARLEKMPRTPFHELVVALAGPLVNVLIVVLLFALFAITTSAEDLSPLSLGTEGFLQRLIAVNLMLVVFNMLPAFPMDGGRVLRAVLAMFTNYSRATRIAALVGQVCAVGIALLGIFNPFLFLIAAFVFFGAATEAQQVTIREQFRSYRVRDAIIRSFRAVHAEASVRELAEQVFESAQRDFPVIAEGRFVGMLDRNDLLVAVERGSARVARDAMRRDVDPVEESEQLVSVLERASGSATMVLPVTSEGALSGLLDLERAAELIRARATLQQTGRVADFAVRRPSPRFT